MRYVPIVFTLLSTKIRVDTHSRVDTLSPQTHGWDEGKEYWVPVVDKASAQQATKEMISDLAEMGIRSYERTGESSVS